MPVINIHSSLEFQTERFIPQLHLRISRSRLVSPSTPTLVKPDVTRTPANQRSLKSTQPPRLFLVARGCTHSYAEELRTSQPHLANLLCQRSQSSAREPCIPSLLSTGGLTLRSDTRVPPFSEDQISRLALAHAQRLPH